MREPDAAILDALYQGAFDIAALERAVELIADKFGCRSAAMVSVDSQAPATGAILVIGIFKTSIDRYLSEYAPIDPAPPAFARLPVGRASTTRRILSEKDHRSRFVKEFYYPLGLVETLGGNLVSDNARSALIGINRGPERPPFSDEDIADLERLMPHITRALQLRRAVVRLEAKAAGLQTAIDRIVSRGVV